MQGICISFNPRNVGTIWPDPATTAPPVYGVPEDDTPFCYFFRPVFPHLRDLYWFATGFESSPFARLYHEEGGEERLEEAWVDVDLGITGDVLHRPGTLPDLAPYIHNDWLDLIGLHGSEERAVEMAHQLSGASLTSSDLVAEVAEIAFFCVDGFWWEFYSRDTALLELVRRPLAGRPGIEVGPRNLRDRDQFL